MLIIAKRIVTVIVNQQIIFLKLYLIGAKHIREILFNEVVYFSQC